MSNVTNQERLYILHGTLVPDFGSASTVEGELVRAAGKLSYEYHNNGFCNNVSGPANFIVHLANTNKELHLAVPAIEKIEHYLTGAYCPVNNKEANEALEVISGVVVDYVNSKQGVYTNNTFDMFDFSDPDHDWDEEEEDDYWDEEDDYWDEEEEDGYWDGE